ncbi:hypothetical protein M662_06670 [Bacillus sp. SB49]|uniref:hypothetical protein n=1 Tax=Bacillus sp. SB49 TaxID=1071080 RepID=UPI0004076B23|nr:hypothetical protein [Bacillus sp. SB49]QHT46186.1 hypothetical protein M662_06670 [Bacillus sp. SB49]
MYRGIKEKQVYKDRDAPFRLSGRNFVFHRQSIHMRGGVGFTVAALLDFLITVVLFTLVGGFFGYGIWKGKRDQQETE